MKHASAKQQHVMRRRDGDKHRVNNNNDWQMAHKCTRCWTRSKSEKGRWNRWRPLLDGSRKKSEKDRFLGGDGLEKRNDSGGRLLIWCKKRPGFSARRWETDYRSNYDGRV